MFDFGGKITMKHTWSLFSTVKLKGIEKLNQKKCSNQRAEMVARQLFDIWLCKRKQTLSFLTPYSKAYFQFSYLQSILYILT